MNPVSAGAWALVASALSGPLVLRMISGRVVDTPNQRSSHSIPTPRGGGISLIVGVSAGLFVARNELEGLEPIFWIALALGILGLVEDIWGLKVPVRLAIQAVVSLIGAALIVSSSQVAMWIYVAVVAVAALWLVGFTNIFNFMDGINGIAGVQLVIAGVAWGVLGVLENHDAIVFLGVVTAGAAAGFLPWNFPRAKFFMGDVGSYFAGGWLALAVVFGIQQGVDPVAMVAPLLVFVADASVTLILRMARREDWLRPHRSHVYQRLVICGWSHTKTTLFFVIVAVAMVAFGLAWRVDSPTSRTFGGLLAAGSLAIYFMLPGLVERRSRDEGT